MVTDVEAVIGERQLQAVAGDERQLGSTLLADIEHALGEVTRNDERPSLVEGHRRGSGPGREVENAVTRSWIDRCHDRAPPLPVLTE